MMNWQLTKEDFQFMTELEPNGCFVLFYNSKRIGIVTNINFGKIGWLGNLIINKKHRRKGCGTLMVKHSIEYLMNRKNVETIGLYSYIKTIPFYLKLGFVFDSEFVVLRGRVLSSSIEIELKEIKKEDIQKIVDYDNTYFGASRKKVLESIFINSNNLSYVAIKGNQILGYGVVKVYGTTAELGPLIANPGCYEVAIDIFKALINKLKGVEVSICVPKKEKAFINMLITSGFSRKFSVARMFFGSPVIKKCFYIAESLERG
jgi:hypothetical protein